MRRDASIAKRNSRRIPRNHCTRENRGIEAISIPRFSRCAGAQRGLYTSISLQFEKRLTG